MSLMLANVFAIMSFVVTWFATAVLLSYRPRRIGRIKYWVIIALPLIYFLSQFISSITDESAPLISSDPVTFAIVITLIFTLSKLAGGILFGFAFWSIAKTAMLHDPIRILVYANGYQSIINYATKHRTVQLRNRHNRFLSSRRKYGTICGRRHMAR